MLQWKAIALLALQRAPDHLQSEIRRQRFDVLRHELHVLGIEWARVATLTVADVKAARAERAKALHPDVRGHRGASPPVLVRPTHEAHAPHEAGNGNDDNSGAWAAADAVADAMADAQDAMCELNRAYTLVKRAVSAQPYDMRDPTR